MGAAEMDSVMQVQTATAIRWMIRRDMPSVLRIENEAFPSAWTEEEFIKALRHRDTIGMVAEHQDEVVGYMVYQLCKSHIHILNFAVAQQYRRQFVGLSMIDKLISKLHHQRRNRILLEVRESNLEAQLFFRSLGFKASSVLRNFYPNCSEDAYLFQYRLPECSGV
jgi:ribosomal-protein-alanine N-acetyltransferase